MSLNRDCTVHNYDQSKKQYFFIVSLFYPDAFNETMFPLLCILSVFCFVFQEEVDMISLLIYDYCQEVKCRYHISNVKTKRIIWSARNTNYQVVTVNYIYLSTKLFSCQCLFKWNRLIKLSKTWAVIREKYKFKIPLNIW